MAWIGTVTDEGRKLLTAWAGESLLAFEGAQAGQGLVDSSQLAAQTALADKRQDGGIIGKETLEGGMRLEIRLTAADEAYEMTQIGVTASVDGGTPMLLALFQQDEGVPIPAFADSPDFAYTFYALIMCSNTEDWEVRIDTSALATVGDVQEGMEAVLQECIPRAQLGQPGGAASLDSSGKIPAAQLPGSNVAWVDVTIPAGGWTSSESLDDVDDRAEGELYLDLPVEDAAADLTPNVILHKSATGVAKAAGLSTVSRALAGVVRLWSQQAPTENMEATIVLLSDAGAISGGGGTYVLPVATKTRLGGVKLGDGFSTTPDGTLSYVGSGLPDEAVTTTGNTEEMLDDVFPPEEKVKP